MHAILGKKIGMTRFLDGQGRMIPATVLEAGPCTVTEVRTQARDGYDAVQLGFEDAKAKHLTKAARTAFDKKKLSLKRSLKEVRLAAAEKVEIGQEVKVDIFKAGDLVDVQGTSIGKGFAGGMKRWHWSGGPETHGSMHHRRIGSVGASSFPSRTWPGWNMPGHLGDVKRTVQNLEVLKVDAGRNLLLVKGSVPGGDQALLYIRRSLKRPQGIPVKAETKKVEKKKDAGKKTAEKKK